MIRFPPTMSALLLIALATPWASTAANAGQGFDPWTQTARYEFEYRVDLGSLPDGSETRKRALITLHGQG